MNLLDLFLTQPHLIPLILVLNIIGNLALDPLERRFRAWLNSFDWGV